MHIFCPKNLYFENFHNENMSGHFCIKIWIPDKISFLETLSTFQKIYNSKEVFFIFWLQIAKNISENWYLSEIFIDFHKEKISNPFYTKIPRSIFTKLFRQLKIYPNFENQLKNPWYVRSWVNHPWQIVLQHVVITTALCKILIFDPWSHVK